MTCNKIYMQYNARTDMQTTHTSRHNERLPDHVIGSDPYYFLIRFGYECIRCPKTLSRAITRGKSLLGFARRIDKSDWSKSSSVKGNLDPKLRKIINTTFPE